MARPGWKLRSEDLNRLDEDLYVVRPGTLAWKLNHLDRGLYARETEEAELLLPEEIWDYWIQWGQRRIRDGQDIIVVIDADRRATGSPTRIGKSTLGMLLLKEWDPTFRASTVAERYAPSPSALAQFDLRCRPGQGVLYDEGMWGGRGRDAMSPENKLLGEILGTLASRQAIVVMCTHSMLTLDADVKALASLRLLVRERGLAEAHVPMIHFDLEKPRLLPFRQHPMSPLRWRPLSGPIWDAYSRAKEEAQNRRIEFKIHEQAVSEARRLGLNPKDYLSLNSAGGPVEGGGGVPSPSWECASCGRKLDNQHNLEAHQARCSR